MAFNPEGDDRSQELCAYANENGAIKTLEKYSNYTGAKKELIAKLYDMVKNGKPIKDLIAICDDLSGKEIKV